MKKVESIGLAALVFLIGPFAFTIFLDIFTNIDLSSTFLPQVLGVLLPDLALLLSIISLVRTIMKRNYYSKISYLIASVPIVVAIIVVVSR